VNCINFRRASLGLVAYYNYGGLDTSIGEIVIEQPDYSGERIAAAVFSYSGVVGGGAAFSPPIPDGVTVTSVRSAGVVTVTSVSGAHGFVVGQIVSSSAESVLNYSDANFPYSEKTIASVPTTTTFTYLEAGADSAATVSMIFKPVTVFSDNQTRKNGLQYSKPDQPEAFPLINFLPVGTASDELLRAIPLRDKLFCFPSRGGVYTVAGFSPFRVDLLDDTVKLIGADTVVTHGNQIFALTTQGFCSISDSGVRIISKPIEDDLLRLFGSALSAVKALSFSVSYESDRQCQLWLPTASTDTFCTQAWVYNSILDDWTHWTKKRQWGRVNPATNKLHMGIGDTNRVAVERKLYDRSDYFDETITVTLSAFSGKTLTVSSVSGISVGDVASLNDSIQSVITAVNTSTNQLTVLTTENWSIGSIRILVAFPCEVKWCPVTLGAPAIEKQWREVSFHFRKFGVSALSGVFDTEIDNTSESAPIALPGFGLPPFGSNPFGQQSSTRNVRAAVDRRHARSTGIRVGLTVREALATWALDGFSIEYEVDSERNSM
jgi:hypothetical protein